MTTNRQSDYSSLFARLGFPLTKRDGIPAAQLTRAEDKLGIRLPQALRNYYLVAGREKVLNQSFNRLCSPGEWQVHSSKLIFMEENQTAVVWGVSATKRPSQDPVVYQCPLVSGELDKWYSEKTQCMDFLKFMIHLQAAYGGGMPFTASATAVGDPLLKLKPGWSSGGEVNGMRAYSGEGQVICTMEWHAFGSKKKTCRVFGGATTKEKLMALAAECGINWDS